MLIKTKIDEMIRLVEERGKVNINDIAKELDWDAAIVDKICRTLAKAGLVEMSYPANPLQAPWVRIKKAETIAEEKPPEGNKIAEYDVATREGLTFARALVIENKEKLMYYWVAIPRVSAYVQTYFRTVRDAVSKKMPLDTSEKTGEEGKKEHDVHYGFISEILAKDLAPNKNDLSTLCNIILNTMYGLGDLEVLIMDILLEEIVINSSKVPISVYHRKYGWLRTNLRIENEDDIENYAAQIGRKIGREINLLHPILDAHLLSGDRVNATLYPVSTGGNTITIRLFARNPWTMVSFLKKEQRALSLEMAALLWQAVHYEMNVIIAGGTGSGKTSALNALVAMIPPRQRIVTIEDTRELVLPSYMWNWVPLATRAPNPEGLGEVAMLDLVVNALRMRPDRIVMGEIRRKKEAEVLFEAMHTGHSVYGTIHADTGSQVIKRLTEPPIEVPASEVEDIHLLLVQYRDRRKNLRRTLELSEVVPGVGKPEINHVYTWKSRTDEFQFVKKAGRYIEQMNLHTGMTEKEVLEDQKNKCKVLQWMIDNKLEDIDGVGAVMQAYYCDEKSLLSAVEKKLAPSKVL